MEINHETTKRLYNEKICVSYAEGRRIQLQMPNQISLEKFILRCKNKKS